MSFIYSRALVVAFSQAKSSETGLSALLSTTPMPQAFSSDAKTTDTCRRSRYGMTFAPLTEAHGVELLTLFRAASRAKTSASPATAPGSRVSGRDFGKSSQGLFASVSPHTSGWKTPQCSLLGDSESFSETWPRSGSMRSGMCYLRRTLAPHIYVNGYGLLLPTLTVCGNYNAKGASATSGDGLATVLKRMLPTLVARDYKHPGRSRMDRTGGTHGECLPQEIGGPLNPDWCEWFMGWPVGWTESKPLEMGKFQEWQQQHSPRSQVNSKEAA